MIKLYRLLTPYLLLTFILIPSSKAEVKDGNDQVVSAVSFIGQNSSTSLPLITGRGLYFTKSISINGSAAGVFLIDTGANVSIIDRQKALELGLAETFQGMSEVSDVRKFRFLKIKELQLGRMTIKNHFIYSGKVTANYPRFSEPVVGIIGADILGKMPFKLDLHNLTLNFYKPEAFKPSGKALPLKLANNLSNLGYFSEANPHAGVPLIQVKINDNIHEELMIDTAESDAIILRSNAALRNQTLAGSFKVPLILRKSGSSLIQFNALIKKVTIDKLNFVDTQKFSYILMPRQGFMAEQSQIGNSLLQNCLISADYKNQKIWIEQAKSPVKYRSQIDFAAHTALARAVRTGNEIAVKTIISEAENLNFKGLKGETLLMLATEGKSPAVMEMLVKKFPILVNAYNHAGVTALMRAASANQVLMVDTLLKNKAQLERIDIDGMNALHYSILGGSLVVMDKLIRHKANINLPMKNGMRPLSLAAGEGNKQLFSALLEAGADITYIDKNGRNLIHLAAYGNKSGILDIILKSKNCPPIDAPSKNGMSPLMVAVKYQRIESIKTLLNHGASIKVMNSKDFTTALDLAYKTNNDKIIDIIQEAWEK